jgi:DNA-binding transcriptional ArsR family regulator
VRIEEFQFEAVSRLFRLLGDTTRLRIVKALWDNPATVSKIVEALEIPQTAVSRNLSVMHSAGLLVRRRAGVNVIYSISFPVVRDLCQVAINSERQISSSRLGLATDLVEETS